MGKTKMEMKPIQSPSRRQVTFSKRKNGLLKKAYELSVLCDVEVALIIFSGTGKICEFASHDDMATLLAKYRLHSETAGNPGATSFKNLKFDESRLQRLHEKMDALQKKEKNMVGEDLEPLTLKELQRLEKELQTGIKRICDRKMGIFSQNSRLLIQKINLTSVQIWRLLYITLFLKFKNYITIPGFIVLTNINPWLYLGRLILLFTPQSLSGSNSDMVTSDGFGAS